MAKISTSIELYDRVSAPIYKMLGALGNLTDAFESVETSMDGSFDASKIEEARRKTEQAALEVVQLGNDIENIGNKSRKSSSDVDGLTNKIMGMVSAYASLQGVQKLVNLSDEYTQTTARLGMIVDKQNTVESLQDKIFAAAQRSRGAYADTADMVAKLSLRTGDLFTNDEAIVFAENLNKLYTIAGASQEEMRSSQLQLTQALGSGVLRGEEFNAVFEAAPNVMQQVADYMGVPIGSLREMAKEGQITGDIVKNALLSIPQEVQDDFNNMPMTWAQVWTGIMNRLYMASQPILEMVSWLAQNWSIIEPIVLAVAAALAVYLAATKGVELATKAWAAAQAFFNGVMALNPVFLIIMGIILLIGLIYSVIAIINKVTGSTISATGVIVGALLAAASVIWNLFLTLVSLIIQNAILPLTMAWDTFANFFGNIFNDPVATIIRTFENLANAVLGILQTIANGIDAIFGSNLSGVVQGWMNQVSGKADELVNKYGNGTYEEKSNVTGLVQDTLNDLQTKFSWDTSDAYNTGYEWGANKEGSISEMFSGIGEEIVPYEEQTATNTGETADALEITSEDLKYMKDIAERDVINRFTTAEIKVDMTNNNTINKDMDLDGVVDYLTNGVNEAMEKAAEGVHE